ncbi:MAG: peptide chain release factor-like protein [Aureliella sp.]
MPIHPSCLTEEELLKECTLRSDRRSGPGGQHRNKVETAVIIVHQPTGTLAEANQRRSQADNRREAIARLRLALATRVRVPATSPAPSELWQQRTRAGRLSISSTHFDFACVLAECLDRLYADNYALQESAEFFGVTSSQLIKLLRQHSPALLQVNAARADRGMHKLS